MSAMLFSTARRRGRRWPYLLGALLVVAAAGGAILWFTVGKPPEDVSNPDVAFQSERPKRPRGERFVWPMFGLVPERTRYLEARIAPPYRQLWKLPGKSLLEFAPVLANGMLFQIRNDGIVLAFSARTGRVRWRRRIGRLSAAAPAWSRGRLYVTSLSGRIVCLEARSGRVIWSRDLASRSESSPLVLRERVFFATEDGRVFALRARDGREIWRYQAEGVVSAAVSYSKGLLYFGDYAGQMTALRARDGSPVWNTHTAGLPFGRAGGFYSTPALAFGRVYAGNLDGKIYSFSARTGEVAWTKSTGNYVYGSAAVADVPGLGPTVYIGSHDGNFYALDARSGNPRWTYPAGGAVGGAATVVGRVVYFSTAGQTFGVDARTGRRVFRFPDGRYSAIISDGRRLYVTGFSTQYAFAPTRGGRRGRGSGGGQPSTAAALR